MDTSQELKIDKNNNSKPQQRPVFDTDEMEARWMQLQTAGPSQEHSVLLGIYERLLQRGPWRSWAKPLAVPDMAALYAALPNFAQPLDEVKRQLALSQDSDEGLALMPMLLLGPPGIGKTHFARQMAQLVGIDQHERHDRGLVVVGFVPAVERLQAGPGISGLGRG